MTGHYGSGKTELAINFAICSRLAGSKVALIDLDIANPYFRSRERAPLLAAKDIDLISNAYDCDITADLPALSSRIGKYIMAEDYQSVVDVGGNDSGARILNQYMATLKNIDSCILMVVNTYRPETDDAPKIIEMARSIEAEIGWKIHGIVNNSNLLEATRFGHITDSVKLLEQVSALTGIPVVANCCKREFYDELTCYSAAAFPIDLFMRPKWLDS
ncbi:MAG: hypothetical protein LBO70_06270 [Clostridiales Family XIII bacterium]|nr:hypothetical protein [Clostridiales Family XIII bacterium]